MVQKHVCFFEYATVHGWNYALVIDSKKYPELDAAFAHSGRFNGLFGSFSPNSNYLIRRYITVNADNPENCLGGRGGSIVKFIFQ